MLGETLAPLARSFRLVTLRGLLRDFHGYEVRDLFLLFKRKLMVEVRHLDSQAWGRFDELVDHAFDRLRTRFNVEVRPVFGTFALGTVTARANLCEEPATCLNRRSQRVLGHGLRLRLFLFDRFPTGRDLFFFFALFDFFFALLLRGCCFFFLLLLRGFFFDLLLRFGFGRGARSGGGPCSCAGRGGRAGASRRPGSGGGPGSRGPVPVPVPVVVVRVSFGFLAAYCLWALLSQALRLLLGFSFLHAFSAFASFCARVSLACFLAATWATTVYAADVAVGACARVTVPLAPYASTAPASPIPITRATSRLDLVLLR